MKKKKVWTIVLILLSIFLVAGKAVADLPKPDATSTGYYSGDAHLHTSQSKDAELFHPFTDVNDMVTAAKRESLNWIAITDHSEVITGMFSKSPWDVFEPDEWQSQQEDIAVVTDFPVISGEEITMGNGNDLETQGHFLGYGLNNLVQTLYDASDPSLKLAQGSLNEVRNQGVFGYIAHPYRFGALFSFMDAEPWKLWNLVPENEDIIKGIELLHASHEAPTATVNTWDKKLQQGKKFFAIGNSDAHQAGASSIIYPVVGEAFTYVKTNGALTKDSILEALKSGHSVVSNGPFIDVKVAGKGPGETVNAQVGDNLQIVVEWNSNQELKKIEVFDQTTNTAGKPTPINTLAATGFTGSTIDAYTVTEDGYIRVKEEAVNGKVAYSNPVFVQIPGSSQESKIFQQTNNFNIQNITKAVDGTKVSEVKMYKKKIAWKATTNYLNSYSDIYVKDLDTGSVFPIATGPRMRSGIDIYENIVVWSEYRNNNWDIYAKDISTGQEIRVTDDPAIQTDPSIFGRTVAWEDRRNESEPYPANDYGPGSFEIDWTDIYMKNLLTNQEELVTSRNGSQQAPVIRDNKIAWVNYRDLEINDSTAYVEGDIYVKDLSNGQEIRVTTDPANQGIISWWWPDGMQVFEPAIYQDKILWVDDRNRNGSEGMESNTDIYMKDLSNGIEKQLSSSPKDQVSPAIYGDYAIWHEGNRYSSENIVVTNLANDNQKRINASSYYSDIYNNTIVWEEDSIINKASLFDSKIENAFSLKVNQGEASIKQVNIKSGLLQTEFNLSKEDNILTTLIQPNGKQISAISYNNNVTYARTENSESFKIDNPMPGSWQLKLEPLSVSAEGENIEVDNLAISETPPTVNLPTPNDKAVVRNTISISANATDDEEIKDFSLALDGEPTATSSDNKNISYNWDTTQKPDGYHELSAIASDVKQSIGQDSHTVIVDNYQPQSIIETANWITNSLLIDFDASKSVDVAESNYDWDFGDGSVLSGTETANHTFLTPGIYNISLTVQDAAGNNSMVSKQLVIDMLAPTQPTNVTTKLVSSSQVDMNWLASTDDISGVRVYEIERSTDGLNFAKMGSTAQTKYSDNSLVTGTYYYRVKSVDNADNTSSYSNLAQVVVGKINIVNPSDGSLLTGNVDLKTSFSADFSTTSVNYYYRVKGTNVWNLLGTSTMTPDFTYSWNTASFNDGSYEVRAEASYNNITEYSPIVSYNLDNPLTASIGSSYYFSPNGDAYRDLAYASGGTSRAATITVRVYRGTTYIKTLGMSTGTSFSFIWDGKDYLGRQVFDSNYRIEVRATDSSGKSKSASSYTYLSGSPVRLTQPISGSNLTGTTTLKSTKSAYYPYPVNYVSYYYRPKGDTSWRYIGASVATDFAYNWDTSQLTDGNYEIYLSGVYRYKYCYSNGYCYYKYYYREYSKIYDFYKDSTTLSQF